MNGSSHERPSVYPSEHDIDDRGRVARGAAGIGMLAVGGAAAAFVGVTGEYTSAHFLAGEIAERAFFMMPGIYTAYNGLKLLRR